MSNWKRIHSDKDGHQLYVRPGDRESEVYVGDCSGPNPDETDDGPLFIHRVGVITLMLSHGYLSAPLKVDDCYSDHARTIYLSAGCAKALALRWGIPLILEVGDKYIGKVRALVT
jgi:hypothetical protein